MPKKPPESYDPPVDLGQLQGGDPHYMAYVGPPLEYDLLGAMQFRILTAFGLRAHHRILDFGCGSLRAGRLLIPYLNAGNYFGIEPNEWLIEQAIQNQIGDDQIRIKRPNFSTASDFTIDHLGVEFDYIMAQSIFSHTGTDLVARLLASLGRGLKPSGLILATFVDPKWFMGDTVSTGWIYPKCVSYRSRSVHRIATEAGLYSVRLRWRHPRQTWYAFARTPGRLPSFAARAVMQDRIIPDHSITHAERLRKYWAHWFYARLPLRR